LVYATYFGGEGVDLIRDIAVDQQGNFYLVGRTNSEAGIATPGAYQQNLNGPSDVFIAKFDPSYILLWSTYFGGESIEDAYGIETISDSSLIITGITFSENDISSTGSFQEQLGGDMDAFLTKFSLNGDLIWSTYFGGINDDRGYSIAIQNNNIFFVGQASSDGLATPGAYQENIGGFTDGFLSMFSSDGEMIWTTYFGGESGDKIIGINLTNQNELILYGETASETNIATENVYQETYSGENDCFITKFTLSGERVWGTYYGGTGFEQAYDIDFDNNGNIITSGYTVSISGIATPDAHKTIKENDDDFLASFNSGGQINWGTYFGGARNEFDGNGISVYGNDIYLTGRTESEDGITAGSPYQTEYAGPYVIEYFNSDIYFTKFNSDGQQIWGTYYGGIGVDIVDDLILIDENTLVLAAGSSGSGTTVTTPDALNPQNAGLGDGLLAVFDVDLLISVNEIEPGELNVYPNPANSYFVIKLPKTIRNNGSIEIYTLEGKRIDVFNNYISGNRIPLDLAPGMYIVSYRLGNIDLRTKLVVE